MINELIGILGGTFDPIHYGHLRLAEEMLELVSLEKLLFIPAGMPPHRNQPQASALHRMAMVKLAITGRPGFALDDREVMRSSPCYTVETLRELRTEVGGNQALCLLMGGDAFLQLDTWHEWERLFDLAHIVVGCRPGFSLADGIREAAPSLLKYYKQRLCPPDELSKRPGGGISELAIPRLEISATMIRSRIAECRSIKYLLPDAVADYIYQHHLYEKC